MPDIAAIIQSGAANAWLLLPVAIVLGALHALEPGHAKSMMAAFIIAIHGTVGQAVLLALSATVGHTIVVWALAILAWQMQDTALLEKAEPWLLLVGGLLIVTLALRILSRLGPLAGHPHDHSHPQGHHHAQTDGHDHHHEPERGHAHKNMDEDAHAAAHAAELKGQLSKGPVSNTDVAWFGFSGGLMPCPAAFAVLLACFHQKAYALGIVLVAAFSVGLALTLVAVGVLAALGAKALAARQTGLDRFSRWAPYASAGIVLAIGLVVTAQGLAALKIV
jgi:nickel/cobalt transporter (NicO) family protein